MTTPDTALIIEPTDLLEFNPPYNQDQTTTLKLTNTHESKKVCVKMKVNEPDAYRIKPNNTIINPKESIAVQIILNAFQYDKSTNYQHKFLVQSLCVPENETCVDKIFRNGKTPPLDQKLTVLLQKPGDVA